MALLEKIINATQGIKYDCADCRLEELDVIVDALKNVIIKSDCLFFIGNGGSAAIAIHMTADFMKNGGCKTVSMYDPAILTCLGNDYGYEHIFSKQLERIVKKNDLLIAISSSGNSPNIINAIDAVHKNGAQAVSLTGFGKDNICWKKADYSVYIPSDEYGTVESVHNMILQEVVDRIKNSCNYQIAMNEML